MSKYDDLVTKLKEIFQIDKPELDFGIYRILNARAAEINDYLENRLKAKVAESLAASGAANLEGLHKELKEKEAQYSADGIDPNAVPKIQEIKQKLAAYTAGSAEHENAVFTHLLIFFSRYYDKGDFISQRRYKGDTYAIPYAGEEVVLHWANKDQYYTKSGENFSNYAFKLDDGRSVRFRLVAADTAKDNRKDNDKERRFVLIEPQSRTLTDDEGEEYRQQLAPVAEENGELVLRFEYKAMPKGSKQDDLVAQAVKIILETLSPAGRGLGEGQYDWHTALSKREPTEKNPQRTLLEKALTNYTAKNSADYFIHKDLGGFLRRELDFYIKNEVMNLDDVQHAEKFADIERNLRMIQTLRSIALDLITFLAQLEDFQKKLWLKKKFVVAAHYCVTLDRIIKDAPQLLDTIAANPKQWAQWETLGMLETVPPSPVQNMLEAVPPSPVQSMLEAVPPSPVQSMLEAAPPSPVQSMLEAAPPSPVQSILEAVPPSPVQSILEAVPPSPLRGEGRGEGQKTPHQIKTRSKAERSEIIQAFAKEMRQAPTDAEARLWYFLRNRRLGGFKFRRQHAIDRYIVDFICVDARLVIELDGGQHGDIFAKENDAERSAFLAARGLRVLRFWNNEVLQQTEAVLERILSALDEVEAPHPNPLPTGEREQNGVALEPQPGTDITSANKALSPAGRGLGEGNTIAYLQQHPYLMVDSALFDASFKQALLASIDDLDDSLDGLLIHGDNFQALNLLQERYKEQVKCVYIDPPYNTGGDGFSYKDSYKHSSWLSSIEQKLFLTKLLQASDSSFCASIDDNEVINLSLLLTAAYGEDNKIADLIWQKRYSPDIRKAISDAHEYLLIYATDPAAFKASRNLLPLGDEQTKQFSNPDNDPRGPWKAADFTAPGFRPNQMYEIKTPDGRVLTPPPGRCWMVTEDNYEKLKNDKRIIFGKDGNGRPAVKRFLSEMEGMVPWTWWDHQSSGHSQEGLKEGSDLFSREGTFSTQKPTRLIQKLLHIVSSSSSVVLDYFAGSGTTAHATINLNRKDNGHRKYILVEQGDYFDTVLKPRIQKVVYSADWKDGKPLSLAGREVGVRGDGISHAFKVLKIESYEDTLNNLALRRTEQQLDLLHNLPQAAQDDYLLRYMLDIESRGSLLSVEQFRKPFDVKLKVAIDSAGAYEERPIDLVETFNYLIGLRVKHIDMQLHEGYAAVVGLLPTGEETLVFWRDVEKIGYDRLWSEQDVAGTEPAQSILGKLGFNPRDSAFKVIYINGDHNIPSVFTSLENEGGISKTLKIRQIEPEFLSRMFDVEAV